MWELTEPFLYRSQRYPIPYIRALGPKLSRKIKSLMEWPWDVSLGSLPVVLLYVNVDNLQTLADTEPTYRRISKAERHEMKVTQKIYCPAETSRGDCPGGLGRILDESPNVIPR